MAKSKEERISKFKAFLKTAQKRWDKSITLASDIPLLATPRLSTGNFGMDIATFGGLPPGISRFYGTPRSTKTGSCLNAAADWQAHCGHCYKRECACIDREPAGVLWVDAEGKTSDSLMLPWMRGHGINTDAMLIERPDSGNEVVDVIDAAIRDGIKFVVLDSMAHLTVKDEIQKAAEDGITPGRGAMLCNSAMRKWVMAQTQYGFGKEDDSHTDPVRIVIINQLRSTFNTYSPDILPGGRGQEFATRLDVSFHSTPSKKRYRVTKADGSFSDLKEKPDDDARADYQETSYRVVASSQCPPGREGTYNYWLKADHGRRKGDPDNAAQLVTYMNRYEFIHKIKSGYAIKVPEDWIADADEAEEFCAGHLKEDVITSFRASPQVQAIMWRVFVRKLNAE